MWFDLKGDERINQRCATEGCGGQPTSRLEADGSGSNYCSGCRTQIELQTDRMLYGQSFQLNRFDGTVERIPPERIVLIPEGDTN